MFIDTFDIPALEILFLYATTCYSGTIFAFGDEWVAGDDSEAPSETLTSRKNGNIRRWDTSLGASLSVPGTLSVPAPRYRYRRFAKTERYYEFLEAGSCLRSTHFILHINVSLICKHLSYTQMIEKQRKNILFPKPYFLTYVLESLAVFCTYHFALSSIGRYQKHRYGKCLTMIYTCSKWTRSVPPLDALGVASAQMRRPS